MKWAGEKDGEAYKKHLSDQRRDSLAFRNEEGKRVSSWNDKFTFCKDIPDGVYKKNTKRKTLRFVKMYRSVRGIKKRKIVTKRKTLRFVKIYRLA